MRKTILYTREGNRYIQDLQIEILFGCSQSILKCIIGRVCAYPVIFQEFSLKTAEISSSPHRDRSVNIQIIQLPPNC